MVQLPFFFILVWLLFKGGVYFLGNIKVNMSGFSQDSGEFRKGGSATGTQSAPENFGVAMPSSGHFR